MLPQNPAPSQAVLAAERHHLRLLLTWDGQVESSQFHKNSVFKYTQKNLPAALTKWLFKGWRLYLNCKKKPTFFLESK